MNKHDDQLLKAFRDHPGGIGKPLSDKEKSVIYGGPKNSCENQKPYDNQKLMDGFSEFIDGNPIGDLAPHA